MGSYLEHIIRHYTEGWADGMHRDMQYWDIWNQPDLDDDTATKKRTWAAQRRSFLSSITSPQPTSNNASLT